MLPTNIRFGKDPGRALIDFLNEKVYSAIAVLTDENTHRVCHPVIERALPPHTVIEIPSGETHKNLETCSRIWTAMTAQYLDRKAVMIVVGGGVLGDMGGFCASTYKRGIDFVLVPTTLLAMADASVGGKLGVDFNFYKNHIGVFNEPALTLVHTGFLKSLPARELRSGFAEIIKHTLLSDAALFAEISCVDIGQQDWERLVQHSVEFKSSITKKDPHEQGLRKILNAGHTIGHAMETLLLKSSQPALHGEAIAAGLIAESFISLQKGMLGKAQFDSITNYILKTYGKLRLPSESDTEIARLCLQDKKNRGGKILGVLLEDIGKPKWDCEISLEDINQAVAFYKTA